MLRALALAVLLLPAGALLTPAALAAPSIELLELPERLVLPLPPGTNRLFAARIGGEPEAVWMATAADAKARLPLQPAGDKWVFNLGDRRVAGVIAGGGQFQIFAEIGGRTIESLPVVFTPARAARPVAALVGADGARLPLGTWTDPAKVAAIAVQWTGSGPRRPLTLVTGDVERTITPDAEGRAELKMDPALRKAWRAAHTLELKSADGRRQSLGQSIPDTLDDIARRPFRVTQRRSLEVPGSRRYLTVHLGDVSGSKVPVTLTGADGTTFVEQRLMGEKGRAEFALGGTRYALVIERLVNLLMGDDHVELRVEPAAAALQK